MTVPRHLLGPLLAVAVLAAGAGCIQYRAPFKPAQGAIFTGIKAPLQTNFKQATVYATSGSVSSLYVHDILITGLDFAWDDCSIQKAAANGGLAHVEYAEYEMMQVLGVFGKMTVRAYGPPVTPPKAP